MEIRILLNGHTSVNLPLTEGRRVVEDLQENHFIVDDKTHKLVDSFDLNQDSRVTAYPKMQSG